MPPRKQLPTPEFPPEMVALARVTIDLAAVRQRLAVQKDWTSDAKLSWTAINNALLKYMRTNTLEETGGVRLNPALAWVYFVEDAAQAKGLDVPSESMDKAKLRQYVPLLGPALADALGLAEGDMLRESLLSPHHFTPRRPR